jgi:hypothetical protein
MSVLINLKNDEKYMNIYIRTLNYLEDFRANYTKVKSIEDKMKDIDHESVLYKEYCDHIDDLNDLYSSLHSNFIACIKEDCIFEHNINDINDYIIMLESNYIRNINMEKEILDKIPSDNADGTREFLKQYNVMLIEEFVIGLLTAKLGSSYSIAKRIDEQLPY